MSRETSENKLVVVEGLFGADNLDDLVRNVAYAMLACVKKPKIKAAQKITVV